VEWHPCAAALSAPTSRQAKVAENNVFSMILCCTGGDAATAPPGVKRLRDLACPVSLNGCVSNQTSSYMPQSYSDGVQGVRSWQLSGGCAEATGPPMVVHFFNCNPNLHHPPQRLSVVCAELGRRQAARSRTYEKESCMGVEVPMWAHTSSHLFPPQHLSHPGPAGTPTNLFGTACAASSLLHDSSRLGLNCAALQRSSHIPCLLADHEMGCCWTPDVFPSVLG
jgi:hypothetical protein